MLELAAILTEIVGTPFMVGRKRDPVTPGAAMLIIVMQLLKQYAVLRLAGVL